MKDFIISLVTNGKLTPEQGAELLAALDNLNGIPDIRTEICGCWIWITGETKAHKEALKEIGCRYCSKKKCWAFHPSGTGRGRGKRSMNGIRAKYGSVTDEQD